MISYHLNDTMVRGLVHYEAGRREMNHDSEMERRAIEGKKAQLRPREDFVSGWFVVLSIMLFLLCLCFCGGETNGMDRSNYLEE